MNEWILIALMACITFGIRYVMMASAGRITLPPLLLRSLNYVPVAVLSAMVVQTILVKVPESSSLSVNPAFLTSTLVAFFVARFSKNLMITVVAGLLFYWFYISVIQ